LSSGTQHPDGQSVSNVQSAAQMPPFSEMHVSRPQQSAGEVQAEPAVMHVAGQDPRGAHASIPLVTSGTQHPETHPGPVEQGSAHTACWPVRRAEPVRGEQIPEQQASGALVQSTPADRHAGGPAAASGFPIDASGSAVEASGFSVDASGTPVEASGFSVDASGSPVEASGLGVDASGWPVEASGCGFADDSAFES
jgi:hypothetical protein